MKWTFEYGETDQMLALRPREAKIIADILKRSRNKLQKKYDRYQGIHESGEATERQQSKLFEYEGILGVLDEFIKQTELL